MIADNRNPYSCDTPLNKQSHYWYDRLWEMAVTAFEWKGLPESVNEQYLETVLMAEGSVIWQKDKKGKLRALKGTHYDFDCYMWPTKTLIENPVLGNMRGVIGVNSWLGRNNQYMTPVVDIIAEYALQLARIDIDIMVNLDNYKLSAIFHANGAPQAQKIRNIYADIVSGKPAVINDEEDWWKEDGDFNKAMFTVAAEYGVTKMLQDQKVIMSNFLTCFGINSNPMANKVEQSITVEVESNNEQAQLQLAYWLDQRKRDCVKINKLFGTDISVDKRTSGGITREPRDSKYGGDEE